MPRGAIFISYAREDEAAAKRLKTGLESYGCTVWYDRERLQSGTNFHHSLEDEVKRNCALFLSVVSSATESQAEAYFHLERNWAAQRAERRPDHGRFEFYHLVIVDDLSRAEIRREPRLFSGCQCERLPGGNITTPRVPYRRICSQGRQQPAMPMTSRVPMSGRKRQIMGYTATAEPAVE